MRPAYRLDWAALLLAFISVIAPARAPPDHPQTDIDLGC
jgi:hypothetical protein